MADFTELGAIDLFCLHQSGGSLSDWVGDDLSRIRIMDPHMQQLARDWAEATQKMECVSNRLRDAAVRELEILKARVAAGKASQVDYVRIERASDFLGVQPW